ncbi:MAG: MBL fold metallo-hydrolase [Thermodesulfobacteriota bacterium]|nr:MBL fold metallo-hydrolase [Thermodesulfobacteriota bacterium]
MHIRILGTESLGVRGLCCFVETESRRILIDPGVALGYKRYALLPHPLQIAIDEEIQKQIIAAWSQATDIIISHFHGDHIPLVDANPYQLNIERLSGLNPDVRVWAKASFLSPTEEKRAHAISTVLNINLNPAEKREGPFAFSPPVPHGRATNNLEKVVMTKIEEDFIFVHASDIQLLNNEAISVILSWRPDVVFLSGPPIYLSRVSNEQLEMARRNALLLSGTIDTLIIDHHLLRDRKGALWLEELSSESLNPIVCGADFMKRPRLLLEADRKLLYEKMPVREGWHEAYAEGRVGTALYRKLVKRFHEYSHLDDYFS